MSVFWRWWAAGTTSGLGSAIGGVALPLTALAVLDASPFERGLITAAGYLAWIAIGLPAGVLAGMVGARAALFVFAAVAVCAPIVWLLSPVRGLRDLAEVATGRAGAVVG